MDVKIKKLNANAVIPSYAKVGDAGLDLTAISYKYREDLDCFEYHTGLAVEIPEGFVGLIFPRSSNRKTNAYMTNSVGVIDSGYRGEILVCFKNRVSEDVEDTLKCLDQELYTRVNVAPYSKDDRIAQLIIIPYPKVTFVETDSLSETERGEGGHGSTGK